MSAPNVSDRTPEELYRLALQYAAGEGVRPDRSMAFACCKAAADRGHAEAKFCTAVLYLNGFGTQEDPALAEEYARQAVQQGCQAAQEVLDRLAGKGDPAETQGRPLLWHGERCLQQGDLAAAAEHLRQAAELGVAHAQYLYAALLATGQGVAEDAEQARYWMHKAAENGSDEAREMVRREEG